MKVTNSWQSNAARRVVGYSVSAIIASLIYVIWITVSTAIGGLGTTHSDLPFELGVAFFFLFAGGFALTLLLMIVPWAIAVWAHSKMRWDGRLYFPGVGAQFVFTLGCTAASLSPKPLWIEDQTFLEGAVIAAERQGLCLLVCGIVFGGCYTWLDRQMRARFWQVLINAVTGKVGPGTNYRADKAQS
jgi:hypothetical protein